MAKTLIGSIVERLRKKKEPKATFTVAPSASIVDTKTGTTTTATVDKTGKITTTVVKTPGGGGGGSRMLAQVPQTNIQQELQTAQPPSKPSAPQYQKPTPTVQYQTPIGPQQGARITIPPKATIVDTRTGVATTKEITETGETRVTTRQLTPEEREEIQQEEQEKKLQEKRSKGWRKFIYPTVTFFGGPEGQQVQKETEEYTNLISQYTPNAEGKIEVSQTEYNLIQKEYQDVLQAEYKYKSAPYVQFQSAIKLVSEKLSPFPDYVPVGGVLVPREEFEALSSSQQRLILAFQPESILAMTQYPSIKEIDVKFAGVKTVAKDGKQVTALKFKTSTGESGEALGISKVTGSKGDIIIGRTEILGMKGGTKFGVGEQSFLGVGTEGRFAQYSTGGIGINKQLIYFKAADIGMTSGPVTTSFGRTITFGKGSAISYGKIIELEAIQGGGVSGVTIIPSGGGLKTLLSTTFAQTATQAGVRAAVGTTVVSTTPFIPAIAATMTSVPSLEELQLPRQANLQLPTQTEIMSTSQGGSSRTIQRIKQGQGSSQLQIPRQVQLPEVVQIVQPIQRQDLRLEQLAISRMRMGLNIPIPSLPKPEFIFPFKFPKIKQSKKGYGKFPAFLRRFNSWKIVGYGTTPLKAFGIGKKAAEYTLGASFKIGGKIKPLKTPGFYTKQEKGETIYIEKLGRRIKKGTKELPELMYWKGLKSKKRKKK